MSRVAQERVEAALAARMSRRGLTADLARMRYSAELFYAPIPEARTGRALFVGVGHGLDALVALMDGHVDRVVGVDPYLPEHGNDAEDYEALLALIRDCGVEDRFAVERATVQDYLAGGAGGFDLVVCTDVLHHVFWTDDLLGKSPYAGDAVALFRRFAAATGAHGRFALAEVGRWGLRQVLTNRRILKHDVNYRTKQPWWEWAAAARAGGWRLIHRRTYVPYPLRRWTPLLSNALGALTVCDRYFLHFARD